MSVLNDLKKLLFGAKSVAKSAGNKAVDAGQSMANDLAEQSQKLADQAKQRADELQQEYGPRVDEALSNASSYAEEAINEAWKKGEEFTRKVEDKTDELLGRKKGGDFPEAPDPTPETYASADDPLLNDDPSAPEQHPVEKLGENIINQATAAGKKVEEISEQLGKQAMDQGSKAWDKFQDLSEQVGQKAGEVGGTFAERAKEVGGELKGKFDDLVEKANAEAAKAKENMVDLSEEAKKKAEELEQRIQERSGRSNVENLERDSKEGPLGGFDSFFDKASRYADGDYHNEGGKDEIKISKDPDYQRPEKPGTVKGFEDLDGDGDELIDDAILDEDGGDEPKA